MVEIREARLDDLRDIVGIDPLGSIRAAEIESLIRSAACLVTVSGNLVTGFVARRKRHFFDRDFVELLLVAPAHRRRGIGRALMRRTLGDAEPSRVFVSTNESNEAMQGLLAREGWIASGRVGGLDPEDDELFYRTER